MAVRAGQKLQRPPHISPWEIFRSSATNSLDSLPPSTLLLSRICSVHPDQHWNSLAQVEGSPEIKQRRKVLVLLVVSDPAHAADVELTRELYHVRPSQYRNNLAGRLYNCRTSVIMGCLMQRRRLWNSRENSIALIPTSIARILSSSSRPTSTSAGHTKLPAMWYWRLTSYCENSLI